MSVAGKLPKDLGLIDLNPTEMMFWMYCPIKIPYGQIHLPDNLKQFEPIIARILENEYVGSSYVYVTAKTLWVEGEYIGNRPGWHIDGYGTDDINYIWADRAPTEFVHNLDESVKVWNLSDDCDESLKQISDIAGMAGWGIISPIKTYPDKHLLRLDNTVIHRSPVDFETGMRTFVKVSLSKHQYNLKGNSVNHLIPESQWELVDRRLARNHPTFKNSDFVILDSSEQ